MHRPLRRRLLTRSLACVAVAAALVVVAGACEPTAVGPPGRATCSTVAPCADGLVCADGFCVEPCTTGSCADGELCDAGSGRCVQCLEDGDCPDGTLCNTFSNQCGAQGGDCDVDEDCDGGARCDPAKGACVACLDDSDCVDGVCDLLTQTCAAAVGCAGDDDCDGAVCDPEARVCVECFTAAHCASGQCDTVSQTCVAACEDADDTEPNEGGNAVPLASGGEHEGRICPGDADEFTLRAAGAVDVVVAVDGGRLDVSLRDAAGAVVASGGTGVSAADLADGDYRVVVRGADEGVTADYQLRLTVTAPVVCEQLDAEPNDTNATATALPADALRTGRICGADVDLWRIVTAAGDDVTVTLGAADGEGALAVALLAPGGAVLAQGDSTAPVVLDGAPAGGVIVRVTATGGDVGYTLRATTSAAPPACVQTDAEPNDQPAQAQPLPAAAAADGRVCAGDVDQWRFAANALDDARISLTGTGVRARVLDDTGAVRGEGTASFTVVDLGAGSHRVEISGQTATTEAAYTVGVALTPEPVADPCEEGGLEPDDAASPRALATDNAAVAGRVCADDTDFFRFTVPATRTVAVSVRFVDANGDIDVRLKDAAGALVQSAAGVTDEELIVRQLSAGDYVVEVFGFAGAVNTYTVAASVVTCTEDDFENNDAAATAVPVAGRAVAATRCPADDDFWAVRLESGDALDARLVGTGLSLSLLSATGGFLQGDAADGGNRRLQASGLPAGRYLLRVTGTGAGEVAYTLTPNITPTPARCVDDGAEPNNNTGEPFVLDASSLADGSYALSTLVICDGTANADVFAVDVPGGRSVRFALDHATTSDLDIEVLEQRGASGLFRSLARALSLAGTLDSVGGVANVGARYLVRVDEFGSQPAAGLPYTLGIEVDSPPNTACVDDRFDTWTATDGTQTQRFENDDDTDADNDPQTTVGPVPLSPPETLSSLRICPGDADFYSVSLTAGQRLVVDVTYVHAAGRDVDLRVYGPDDSRTPADTDALPDTLSCTACTGTDGTERFEGTASKAGTHFIEVFGFASGENAYDLVVTTP
jgi:hypothetical protein